MNSFNTPHNYPNPPSLTAPPQPATAQASSNSVPDQLRLVLVGRTGAGKSATGNTILGAKYFESEVSMSSVTNQCKKESKMVQGRSLAVIDTPGWFDTSLSPKDIEDEVLKCLAMCSPGPHAFLLIIPIARFTDEQQHTIDLIKNVFQENFNDHTIIIFTHADVLKGETIERFISKQDKRIQNLIERFGRRFLAFNNKAPDNQGQVAQLLEKLDALLEQNSYRHFVDPRTKIMCQAMEIIEQKKAALMNRAIEKAKQAVRKEVELRKEKISKNLQKEQQEIKRQRQNIQDNLHQIRENITRENNRENNRDRVDSHRLQRLSNSLYRETEKLTQLEEMRVQEAAKQMEEVDTWIREEEKRREEAEREKWSKDDGEKWYQDSFYFKLLKLLMVFLAGAGAGFGAPAIFAFFASAAAPAGLAAELGVLVGPELAAALMAAAAKAAPLFAAAKMSLLFSQCSVQ